MAICLSQYRQVIGLFNSYKVGKVHCSISIPVISALLFFCIVCIILIMSGDIHENPGPVISKSKSLSLCHINIRSLSRSKLLAIRTSICDLYDIITLSETYLHQGVSNDVFDIQGFHEIIRKDRDGHGGGVAIFIRNSIVFKREYEFEVPGVEAVWVSVNTIEGKILIGSCYRPPDKNDFWAALDTVIDNIKQSNVFKYMFILGDLNADFNTNNGRKLIKLCNDQNLQYLIDEPTRVTSTSQTVLDQLLTNAPNFISNIDVSPPVSTNDHCTIGAKINFKISKKSPYHRHIWLYKHANFDQFRAALQNENFDDVFSYDDVDDICLAWSEKFLQLAKSHIPNKSILVRPNDAPWYTSSLRLMKRKLLRLFRKFKMVKSEQKWEAYRKFRNEYQHALDKAEENYNNSLTDSLKNCKNSRGWWCTVKHLLGKGLFRSLPPIETTNNSFITDNKEKASAFNDFFISHSNIDTTNAQLPSENFIEEKLVSLTVSEQEVLDLLKSLDTSKATGPDGISPKLLFEAGHSIVPSLTKLFNLCLSTCRVPDMWKHANVLPLYKKGDRAHISNYRPVSLLSCTSKILERIVFKNLYNYIRDNNILTPHQSGFQSGDSTTHQLSYLYHMFSLALDSKKDIRIVFCDISKAFDRVWHDGLLYKLRKIGIGGNLLSFLQNYLSNRYQSVVVEGQKSEPGLIRAGVPQGSVLGPLLFLVYINDLPNNIDSHIKLFADDTTLYIDVDSHERAANVLNSDLVQIKSWAKQWLVNFSAPKTKLMTCSFRNNDNPSIIFDDVILPETKSHKHLGLTLSNNLSWSEHINTILKSVSPMADVLKKLKYKLDRDTLEQIYFSFIRPKLEYASHIWDNCNVIDAKALEDFQLNIARIVTGARKGTRHDLIDKGPVTLQRAALRAATSSKESNSQRLAA